LAKNTEVRVRANPKQVAYKVYYRNATKFSSKRSALYFQIFYGKKRVSEWIPFTKRLKTVSQKDRFLLKLLTEVDALRQKILDKRRNKARLLREEIKKKKEERKARDRAKREVAKRIIADHIRKKEIDQLDDFLSKEKLNKKRTRYVEPVFGRKTKVVGSVKIVPVVTGTRLYKKQIITKKVISPKYGIILLKTLDFVLKKSVWLSVDNMDSVKNELENLFTPHLAKFFKEAKRTKRRFIYRLKYSLHLSTGEVIKQGFGGPRFYISTIKDLKSFSIGIKEVYENLTLQRLKKYLSRAVGKEIEITGFTLENITRGKNV